MMEVGDKLTYSPRTPEGQAGLQSLKDAMVSVMDSLGVDEAINYLNTTIVPNLQKAFGEEAAKEIGSAVLMAVPMIRRVPGIRAYHGSPHDFDEFSMEQIGTGEGAQAYGHGLYFAEAEDVAKGYRDQLKGNIVIRNDGVQKTYGDHVTAIETAIKEKFPKLAPDNVRTTATSVVNDNLVPDDVQGMGVFDETGYRAEDIYLEGIKANKGAKASKGSMYQVDIDASPDELIDYDLPMSEQSEVVQKALGHTVKNYEGNPEKALRDFLATDYAKAFPEARDVSRAQMILDDPDYDVLIDGQDWVDSQMRTTGTFYNTLGSDKGGSAYYRAAEKMGGTEALSKTLSDKGIKGIRYSDQMSRGKEYEVKLETSKGSYETEPLQYGTRKEAEEAAKNYQDKGFKTQIETNRTSNYVIFDDRLISIAKKYGIAIPAAAALLSQQTGENPESFYQEDNSV